MRTHILLSAITCFLLLAAAGAYAADVNPGDSIQAAIDAAGDGATITVASGTYGVAHLVINKPLTLRGETPADPPKITITSDDGADGVTISASNVTLENLWLTRGGHSGSVAVVGVPKGGPWPHYVIVHSDITLQDCIIEGGRYGCYVHVNNFAVDGCAFLNSYRDSIILSAVSGTTSITNTHISGSTSSKKAILVEGGVEEPYCSGTINIANNTCVGKRNFLVYNQWGDQSQEIGLSVTHNSIDQTPSGVVVLYAGYTTAAAGFAKFSSILVQDNIITNSGTAVKVDYEDYGGAPAADDRSVPTAGQIVVDNNLCFGNTADATDATDATGNYGYTNVAGQTPSSASMAMFNLSGNLVGDPLYADPSHAGAHPDNFALLVGSPALGTASDSTNIGAWQGGGLNATAIDVPDVTGARGSSVDLQATLTSGGTPLVGQDVLFYLEGTYVGTDATDATGLAEVAYAIPVGAATGTQTIRGDFVGGGGYAPASDTGTLTITDPTIVWVDDDWDGPANCGGHTWQFDAFDVIQDGINAVAEGGTVIVYAGAYHEHLTIGKSLSLLGPQQGVDPTGGARTNPASEAIVSLDGVGITNPNILVAVTPWVSDVVIDGFALNGSATFHYADEDVIRAYGNNIEVKNNLIAGYVGVHYAGIGSGLSVTQNAIGVNKTGVTIQFGATNATISGNLIVPIAAPAGDAAGIYMTGANGFTVAGNTVNGFAGSQALGGSNNTNGTVSDNHFTGNKKGISFWGATANLTISGNELSNNSERGIDLKGANVNITGNDIKNNGDAGVRIATHVGATDGIALSNNTITGNTNTGVLVDAGVAGVALNSGDIDGSLVGLMLKGVSGWTLDAGSTQFGAGLTEFVRLDASTADVDATSASFDGAADDAAIEAKVWHDVDDAALGHVDWGQGGATATNLSVQNVSGAKGATVQLAARLTAGGAALAGQAVAISVDGAAVGSPVTDANGWARIDYIITQDAGAFTIAAAFGGVSNYKAATGTGTLTVTTPAPTSITLTMAPNSVAAGQTSTATVTGSNGVDYSALATCYIQYGAGGSWAGNVYTSAKAGTWTVTAVYGSLAATTTLTVNPGAASSVTLAPITASITTDQDQTYTVQATDAQGNSWTPAVADITWNHDGQGAFNEMIYEPDDLDGGNVVNITASVGGVVSNPAALTVISSGGAGTPLILAWDRDTATFYLCTDAANPQAGTALALGNNTVGGITVTVAKTGSSSTDLFATVTNAGVPTNSLRVRWYLRNGAVDKCYSYSTINGTTHTAVYSLGRTSVDGGRSQVGFFGLAHNLDADPPTGITYAVVKQ